MLFGGAGFYNPLTTPMLVFGCFGKIFLIAGSISLSCR
jgi:hypothetical protein